MSNIERTVYTQATTMSKHRFRTQLLEYCDGRKKQISAAEAISPSNVSEQPLFEEKRPRALCQARFDRIRHPILGQLFIRFGVKGGVAGQCEDFWNENQRASDSRHQQRTVTWRSLRPQSARSFWMRLMAPVNICSGVLQILQTARNLRLATRRQYNLLIHALTSPPYQITLGSLSHTQYRARNLHDMVLWRTASTCSPPDAAGKHESEETRRSAPNR